MSLDEIDLQHIPAEDAELFAHIREWKRLIDEQDKGGAPSGAAYRYYHHIPECGPPRTLAGVIALLELTDTGDTEDEILLAIDALREIAGMPLTKPRWSERAARRAAA